MELKASKDDISFKKVMEYLSLVKLVGVTFWQS